MTDVENEAPKMVIEQRDEVEVFAGKNGHVVICQDSQADGTSTVLVHPDDIPQLIEFLERAKEDASEIRKVIGSESE